MVENGYWESTLAGAAESLGLAADRPAQGLGRVTRRLPPATAQRLDALAAQQGAASCDVLMAAFAVLLSRLSGQSDLVLPRLDADGTALPLRLRLDGERTAVDCLRLVAAGWDEAQRHAPAWRGRGLAVPPWQAVFSDGAPPPDEGHPLLVLRRLPVEAPELEIELRFDRALLDEATAADWLGWWEHLLRAMLDQPQSRIDALAMLDARQEAEAIAFGNDTAVAFAPVANVQRLFELQAARTPDATALVDGARRLGYAELEAEANRLARHLRACGVGPDERVAIYVERGIEVVLGLLAVLKAGGAYVPLDPTYPAERLAYTLADSQPRVLLTMSGMQAPAHEVLGELPSSLAVVDMRADAQAWAQLPALPPEDVGVGPEHLAYVLYTSGSTGKPKGVAMPHGPLVNLIQWQLREPGNGQPLRTLQFAALGFDVAFQEVFSTLANGGELHLVDQDTRLSAGKLFEFILDHRIERMFLPYFALQMLAEGLETHLAGLAPGQDLRCALRQVITAGEQLRIEPKIVRFFQWLPGCRLHNHYGPTETHVVTALALDEDPASWPRLPTIGRPIANARVYVLDAGGRPLPTGVAGELYLAGPVVARGYLQRPDLTAGRFLPDPFVGGAARMYRTGDLGRRLPDGSIEYLGRQDFQIKIRGFRVELGEIEAQVMAFPGVREAGVLAREDTPGLKRLVAYLAPQDAALPVDLEALRAHLAARLPDYMVPVAFVQMDALPLSPNGKLDRARLPAPGRGRPDWAGQYAAPRGPVEAALCRIFAEVLDLEELGRDDNFFALGGTSLLAIRVLEAARRARLGDVPPMALFRSPTPALLAAEMASGATLALDPARIPQRRGRDEDEPIAIVAMAGRFPGAASVEALWANLCAGRDSVTRFTADQLDPAIPEALRGSPDYVPARGVFDAVDRFDAAFFGIAPKEAELMDPQQRVFLELCWECIERAGHVPDETGTPVGVFAGKYNASYYQHNVLTRPDLVEKLGEFQVMLGNEKDYIATRVAHRLNLTGPAVSVHTACSTSLVAIAQAIDSLRAGRCGMALAGGVAVTCPVNSGHLYQEGGMLSADGRTCSFDADATGTVFSDGAAVVLLKRLSDAIADGNPIHALIRGAAINNDGAGKASFTAPSSEGQAAVIAMAHADAGVEPRSIGYVETHGTATPMGDPIEIEGLTRAFRLGTDDSGFCVVGSIKSNLGHTLMAAGAAGVIKTAYALQHGCIPPTVHYRRPNPAIDFASSPFRVSGELLPWSAADGTPRRAGVSSFGVGGTNAHVVMEQAPALPASDPAQGPQLLVLSARTPQALAAMATRLGDQLEAAPDSNLADVAWTLAVGRKAFAHRLALVAGDIASAAARLRSDDTAQAAAVARPARAGEAVFLFPGQGCQYAGMGRELHAREPAFREAFDACAAVLDVELGLDFRALVFGDDADALLPTAIMQPAIFSIEYSLARWWMAQGVTPVAMAGHSVGEFVAATLAGVFALDDALRLVARRGRLMQAQPSGAMLSVRMPLQALSPRLPDTLSLAAENAPGACVVAGPHEAVAAFQARLEHDGVACRLLRTSHAFHSSMMEAVVPRFADEVEAIERHAPRIPIVSTATGERMSDAQAVSSAYWARHLREPVRFSTAIARLLERPEHVLVEVGPRATLTTLARQQPVLRTQRIAALASLADDPALEHAALLSAFGQAWVAGVPLQPQALDRRARRARLCLPTYPFERTRYWVDPAGLADRAGSGPGQAPRAPLAAAASPAVVGVAPAEAGEAMAAILEGQLQLMSRQLAVLAMAGEDQEALVQVLQRQHGLMAQQLSLAAVLETPDDEPPQPPRPPRGPGGGSRAPAQGSATAVAGTLANANAPPADVAAATSGARGAPPAAGPPPGAAAADPAAARGSGTAGRAGATGEAGPTGGAGSTGEAGPTGEAGSTGEPGSTGEAGTHTHTESAPAATTPAATACAADAAPLRIPASMAQRDFWQAAHIDPALAPAFHRSVSLTLRGRLDVAALGQALHVLVERHDALRTRVSADGAWLQVHPRMTFELPTTDLSALSGQALDAALAARRRAGAAACAAPERGPPLRAELVRVGEDEHVLLLHAHHLVCDAWSWSAIVRELGLLYSHAGDEAGARLPAALSYAEHEHVIPQRPVLSVHPPDQAWWLSRLEHGAPVLDLPTDRPRAPLRDSAAGFAVRSLDASLARAAQRVAAIGGASLQDCLLATFATLLSRLSGQDEVMVGIPVPGRTGATQGMLGHCQRLLPLRLDLDHDTVFPALLRQARDALRDGQQHPQCDLHALHEALGHAPDPSRPPLLAAVLALATGDPAADAFQDLAAAIVHHPPSQTAFDLELTVVASTDGLRLECAYASALFDQDTVLAWLEAFETLLRGIAEEPRRRLRTLPMAGVQAMVRLQALQPPVLPFDRERRMHEHFEHRADIDPSRVALCAGDAVLDYGTLEARSNQVAHLLRAQGVRRDALVGITLDRGVRMPVAVLGVLKAGAGYVPLDPELPRERLAAIVADAGLSAVLTETANAHRLSGCGVPLLVLDGDHAPEAQPCHRPGRDADAALPDSVAYVIYTSGSTGRPKGVRVPHRAVSNLVASMQHWLRLQPEDAVAAVTPLSFDPSVVDLCLPLAAGARIVMVDRDTAVDGPAFRRLLEGSGATYLDATPSGWRVLLAAGWAGTPQFKAICGGEAMPPDVAQALLARCGEVWNMYGPTETTVTATGARLRTPRPGDAVDVHVGRPVENTQAWIVDRFGHLCPPGVAGELWIGGEGVSLGYLDRPELTARHFVADPFSPGAAGGLLYRTGDRARWRADGNLDVSGRLDFQVKLRGYRIELGEIETALAADPAVAEAAAVVRGSTPEERRLVAYVRPAAGARIDERALAARLRQALPAYMLPRHIVALEAFPLTPNGKLDRPRLPAPEPGVAAAPALAPATDAGGDGIDGTTATIAAAMAGVLELPAFEHDEDFFAAGGHSLLAARLVACLEQDLGVSLKLRSLFDAPTPAALAEVVAGLQDAVPVEPVARQADQSAAPLSLMQQRLWVQEQMHPEATGFLLPSAFRLRGPLDARALERALADVVERQPALRTWLHAHDEGVEQRVAPRVEVALPLEDLSEIAAGEREAELARRIDALIVTPIDTARAPLFRLRLYRLAAHEHVLYFQVHHAIWDGVSFGLFRQEMAQLYAAHAGGPAPSLPSLERSYVDFAAWHVAQADSPALQAQMRHWLSKLADMPEPLRLPEDRPRPAVASGKGGSRFVRVEAAQAQRLRALGTDAGATLPMTLLAAYFLFLHRSTGQRDVVVGLPMRSPAAEQMRQVMGFFVNVLPVRLRLDPAWSFRQLLGQVRSELLDCFAHPDVPLERLAQALRLPRDVSRSPVYQALFSMGDSRGLPRGWGALHCEEMPLPHHSAATDLALWVDEDEERLLFDLNYNADIIDAGSAGLMAQRLGELLGRLAEDPDAALSSIDLRCGDDREALARWNATTAPMPPARSLAGLLAAQAARTPGRVALRFGDVAMRYRDLEARSGRLADALAARGVGAGDMVGVCLERGPDLVATLLAVLKTGAAYVPLDPAYPRERLQFMVGDAGLALAVSQQALAAPLALPCPLLLLDADAGEIEAAAQVARAADPARPEAPAYVIYTSGSTGRPKGVVVPNGAVVNFLDSMRRAPGLDADDRLLAVTTTSFDISVLELFLPLSVGAEVVLASREQALDGEALAALLAGSQATLMQATPATWHMLLDAGWTPRPGFRALCGGEPLSPDLAARLLGRGVALWNLYGPTETTVWSTCAPIAPRAGGLVPDIHVGAPIANTRVWILDAAGQVCPVGVAGEMCIGGAGVSLGYHGQPELTARVFIDDHVGPEDHDTGLPARLYRTGDLGRWRLDG